MTRLFLCRAPEDLHLAKELTKRLETERRAEVWKIPANYFDDDSLHVKIVTAIQQCEFFVLIWSQAASLAPEVMFEWTNALNLQKRLLICNCDATELPEVLRHKKCLSFFNFENGWLALQKQFAEPKLYPTSQIEPTIPTSKSLAAIPREQDSRDKRPDSGNPLVEPDLAVTKSTGVTTPKLPPHPTLKSEPTVSAAIPSPSVIPTPVSPAPAQISPQPILPPHFSATTGPTERYPYGIIVATMVLIILSLFILFFFIQRKTNSGHDRVPPQTYTEAQVINMLRTHNFYASDWHDQGRGAVNDYLIEEHAGGKVILDRVSGLMWQQAGSPQPFRTQAAAEYIQQLNQKKFAGYTDWRLPTLKEAMTLMEPYTNYLELHIDPIFEGLWGIWTMDLDEFQQHWGVNFYNRPQRDSGGEFYVRACR
ncbi:DUF1566 domain-containing protein [candidate division KSB1 bacterium]|nr:DUF1566 domain-containing protein [candidate division KSB1 bacterium]